MSAMDISPAPAASESRASVRSCVTCAKAKAKCMRQRGQAICERCGRLSKECQSRPIQQRKRKPAKITSSEQLLKLESKLEHLVNALSQQQGQVQPVANDLLSPPISQAISEVGADGAAEKRFPKDVPSTCGKPKDEGEQLWETICQRGEEMQVEQDDLKNTTSQSGLRPPPPNTPYQDHTGQIDIRIRAEGERLFDRYRRSMAAGCPYVVIPPTFTYAEMLEKKPMLLRAVAVVASYDDLPREHAMVKDLVRIISERVLVKCEKSIDILQCMLVFLTWYHVHVWWAQYSTNLIHLAIAQTIELNIDRLPPAVPNMDPSTLKTGPHGVPTPKTCTLEERRAVLGILYITDMLSAAFKRFDQVRFTPWHEECLKALEVAGEYDSDRFLVTSVRLQLLVEDLHPSEPQSTLARFYTDSFRKSIEKLKASYPESESNTHLRLQFLAAEIVMWELTYSDLFQEPNRDNRKLLRRHADGVFQCIRAIQASLAVFHAIPAADFLTLPFQTFTQYAHAFKAMLRLATLEADGWDAKVFREHIDIMETIRVEAQKFEDASKATVDGAPVNNDCFVGWANKLRWSGAYYESKFLQEDVASLTAGGGGGGGFDGVQSAVCGFGQGAAAAPAADPSGPGAYQQPTPPDDFTQGDFLAYLDDVFWNNFTADVDFGGSDFNMNMT